MKKSILGVAAVALAGLFTAQAAEQVPYEHKFDSESSLDGYTIIQTPGSTRASWAWITKPTVPVDGVGTRYSFTGDYKDTWLITPAIDLKAGHKYDVTIYVSCAEAGGVIGVSAGKGTTASDMTTSVIPSQYVQSSSYTLDGSLSVDGEFTAPTDGQYYFGVHDSSAISVSWSYIFQIRITEAASTDAPDYVTDFMVVPDAGGALKTTISANAPSRTVSGALLSSLTKMVFYRDGEVIFTNNQVSPGQKVEYVDNNPSNGTHMYGVQAFNSAGPGQLEEKRVYVGQRTTPLAPTDIKVTRGANAGQVVISWTAPEKSTSGETLNASALTYDIEIAPCDLVGAPGTVYLTREDVEGTSITLDVCQPTDAQAFRVANIRAKSVAGEGTWATSQPFVSGKAASVPLTESFANGTATLPVANFDRSNLGVWSISNSVAADEDGGCAVFNASAVNGEATLITGYINLSGVTNPVLNMMLHGYVHNSQNPFQVLVNTGDGNFEVALDYITNLGAWSPVMVDLSKYAGKEIQLGFRAKNVGGAPIMRLDDIRIEQAKAKDLTFASSAIPDMFNAYEPVEFKATVLNAGTQASTAAKVDLYCDGEVVATADVEPLTPGATADITMTYTVEWDVNTYRTFYMQIVWDADENTANNTTGQVSAVVLAPVYPTVQNLKGAFNDEDHVVLTWDAPKGTADAVDGDLFYVLGYNIFRDDAKMNVTPIKECTFTDVTAQPQAYNYAVEVVYDKAESARMYVTVEYASVSAVEAAALVEAGQGCLTVKAAQARVFAANGTLVAATEGETRVELPAGIYAVQMGNNVVKVLVK